MRQLYAFPLFFFGFLHAVSSKSMKLTRQMTNKPPFSHKLGQAPQKDVLYNNAMVAYLIDVDIATPDKQSFKVMADTGSNVLYIQTDPCETCTPYGTNIDSIDYNVNYFYPDESDTYEQGTEGVVSTYGTYTVTGDFGSETIFLDGEAIDGFQMLFALEEKPTEDDATIMTYDGVMGFSCDKQFKNIFDVGYSQNMLKTPLFAFDLTNNLLYYNEIPDDFMAMNVPNTSSSQPANWALQTIGFEVGGEEYLSDLSSSHIFFVTRAPYIYVDESVLRSIINSSKYFVTDADNNRVIVKDCDGCNCPSVIATMPTISIYSTGVKLTIVPQTYLVPYENPQPDGEDPPVADNSCVLGIASNFQYGAVVLGDNFMRSMIITFDKPNYQMYFNGQYSTSMINPSYSSEGWLIILMSGISSLFLLWLVQFSILLERTKYTGYVENA